MQLLLILMLGDWGPFHSELRFQSVSTDTEYLLQAPEAVSWDADAGLFMLDQEAQTVFHWDREGNFVGTIGSPGQGPGEFEFGRIRRGCLAIANQQLWVLSGNNSRLQVFGLDGRFVETKAWNENGVVTLQFFPLAEGAFLALDLLYNMENDRNQRVLVTRTAPNEVLETWAKAPDSGWQHEDGKMIFHAFRPQLVAGYHRLDDRLVYGSSEQPKVFVRPLRGTSQTTTLDLQLSRNAVTESDRRAFESDPVFESPNMVARYPERKPYFNLLLPLNDDRLVVAHQVPRSGRVVGVVVVGGKVKQRFILELGDQGRLMADAGRLVAVRLNQQDEFELHLLAD